MDKIQNAPIIPAGTSSPGGAAYNPLQASQDASQDNGQAGMIPNSSQAAGETQQLIQSTAPQQGQAFAELAEKKGFASPDDLAKAYAELESSFTRSQMGLSELANMRNQFPPVPEAVINPSQVETPEDAVKVVESIVRKVTRPLEDQLALQNLFMQHPDAPQYAEAMGRAVKENPGIGWEAAYKVAKFDSLGKTAQEQGRQEAYQTIAQKQAVAAGVARPGTQQNIRPIDELIMDKSIPFAEVQRIMRERFTQ